MIPSQVVSVACSVGIGVLALITSLHSPAGAQSADVLLCDRLAADPTDPDKPANIPGVRDVAQADVATAIKYCRNAANASRRALYQLGRAYAANQQLADAMGAYRRAAEKGSTSAMVELGVMFGTGTGVPRDEAEARRLFERAAEGGNPRGITNLVALSDASHSPSEQVKVRALLSQAAQANLAEAQYQLGVMAAEGTGGPQDDVAARALFEKAAAQGHAGALLWMGSFALNGRGGAKDSKAAKAYYEQAARLGNEDAKAALKRIDCPIAIRDKAGKYLGCF